MATKFDFLSGETIPPLPETNPYEVGFQMGKGAFNLMEEAQPMLAEWFRNRRNEESGTAIQARQRITQEEVNRLFEQLGLQGSPL